MLVHAYTRQPSLSGGVRGEWSIRHALGDFDGTWHLWPVVLPSPAPGDEEGDAADEANECCVCFDRRINTRLQPCGHVALCHACAARLASSRCPLCRAQIVDVLRV